MTVRGFVSGRCHDAGMPRTRAADAPQVVWRTARCGLRVTAGQRRRLFGLLVPAGDVRACVLELNAWRRRRQDRPLASYQELCRELAASGPGTFGGLDTTGARSVLRRYGDAWFAAARARKNGGLTARFPRRRRRLMPVRWHAGTFTLAGRALRLPAAKSFPPLLVHLDRDVPYPMDRDDSPAYEAGQPRAAGRPRPPVTGRPRRSTVRAGRGGSWCVPRSSSLRPSFKTAGAHARARRAGRRPGATHCGARPPRRSRPGVAPLEGLADLRV